MSTANIAATRLQLLLKDKGVGFLGMAGSVKAYLHQQLRDFPEERAVLEAAYDRGLHTQLTVPTGANRDEFYKTAAEKFAKQAGVHPEWATWAVKAWAAALQEPPKQAAVVLADLRQAVKSADAHIEKRYDDDPQLKILRGGSPTWLKMVMTVMVAIAAFTGAFLGRNGPIGAIMLGFEAVDSTVGKEQMKQIIPPNQRLSPLQKVVAYTLFFAINGGPVAVMSALGAIVGWWFGRADGRPWLGASACFGAGFGVNVIFSLIGCGLVLAPFISMFSCFGAAFKSASTTT
jgi:hypothetical protein